jgi:hypothetical protein
MSKFAMVGVSRTYLMSQRLFGSPGTPVETVGERERETAGRVNTMDAAFCVDCGLKLTGRYCGKCGRD